MSVKPNSAAARDIAYHLHPATNARRHEQQGPMIIESGRGIYVKDDQGKEYIEGLAGLWSVAVGFGEDRLVRAATEQMRKLPYYHSFAHKSHPAAIDLAERLVALTPERLQKVFFTNSGSEANDTAIKLVWYANNARGRTAKKKIISRQKAYHGITIAAGSLTGLPANHRHFDLPLPGFLHVSCPHHYRGAEPGESEEDFATRLADELDEVIRREDPETVAAFIGEPLMGAGGVIVPPRTYWEKVQAVLRKHDVWLIADEVISGFGRTGRMFACETYDIDPDIMVMSKQITSSYAPLAAVAMSDEIYQFVADGSAEVGTFGHGYTGSGHPVATAVAIENLAIIEERGLVGHAAAMSEPFLERIHSFADRPLVGETRGIGLIGAIELVADKASKAAFDRPGATGLAVAEACHDEGLIIRSIGDVVAFCPPLIIDESQIAEMFKRFDRALARAEAFAGLGMTRTFHQPLSGNEMPRFGGIATMMRLPHVPGGTGLDACFVGIPLDIGTGNRSGTRFGARQIRAESVLIRPYNMATRAAPFDSLSVADVGDVPTNPYDLKDSVRIIETFYSGVLAEGVRPLGMGGDHTLVLPVLRAMHGRHGPVGLIHVDAHADVNDEMFGEKIAHGTPIRRAVEEGLIDPRRSVQIGLRGTGYAADDFDWARDQGFRVVPAEECWYRSLAPLMAELRQSLGEGPVYLTFDIDSLDPGFAPGTGTPEPGGLMPHQALEIIRGCRGLDLVGADLVEVSPPYDPSGNTALMAANFLFEMLCVLPGVKYRD